MGYFFVRCRSCKIKVTISEIGPCTDLEYKKYLKDTGISCNCGKNDWELLDFS